MSIFNFCDIDTYLLKNIADTETYRKLSFLNNYYYHNTLNYLKPFREFYNNVKNDERSGKWCLSKLIIKSCKFGNLNVVKYLYSVKKANINVKHDKPFRYACLFGHIDIVKWFCLLGCIDIHINSDCAFVWACINGHINVAQYLVSLGSIDTNVLYNKDHLEDIYNIEDVMIVFEKILMNNHLHIIKWLHECKLCDISFCIRRLFMRCCLDINFDTLRWLFNNFYNNIKDLINFEDLINNYYLRKFPIHMLLWVCDTIFTNDFMKLNQLSFLRILYISKININLFDILIKNGGQLFCDERAFIIACLKGNIDIAKYILSINPINIKANNNFAFYCACTSGFIDIAQWLYSLDPTVIVQTDDSFFNDNDIIHNVQIMYLHEKPENLIRSCIRSSKVTIAQWLFSINYNFSKHHIFIDYPKDKNIIIKCLTDINVLKWIYNINIITIDEIIDSITCELLYHNTYKLIDILEWILSINNNKTISIYLCICYSYNISLNKAISFANINNIDINEIMYISIKNMYTGGLSISGYMFINACYCGNKEIIDWYSEHYPESVTIHKIALERLYFGTHYDLLKWYISKYNIFAIASNIIIPEIELYAMHEYLSDDDILLYEYITKCPVNFIDDTGFERMCKYGSLNHVKKAILFEESLSKGLHILCKKGCIDILDYVYCVHKFSVTPNMFNAIFEYDRLETFKWFFNKGMLTDVCVNIEYSKKYKAHNIFNFINKK